MLRVFFRYRPQEFYTPVSLERLSREVCRIVARAASTEKVRFNEYDVWVYTQPHPTGTSAPGVHFEIQPIGQRKRKVGFNEKTLRSIKFQIFTNGLLPRDTDNESPLILSDELHV